MGDYGGKPPPPEKPGKPAQPEYGKPGHPDYGKPEQSEYGKPEQPEYGGGEEGRCARIEAEVKAYLDKRRHRRNQMEPCDGKRKEPFKCEPLQIPELEPWVEISWGDSECDCIESDDTEIMYVTVCNPYKNVTLSGFSIEMIEVVDAKGKKVALLPDGTPSIQLVPVGPYCFDDIEPCSCVTRQFIVRLRGALGGQYKMMLRGMCYQACIHGDSEGCFNFHVCQD
jgi:hypothetical protein